DDLLQPLEAADRGLHHREVRMTHHDDERARLSGELLRMREMAAPQLEAALDVVGRRDDNAARRVIEHDAAIDRLEQETSHDVMRLALGGPLARDLRGILAALRIASDIAPIGVYAANVAKRSLALNTPPPLPQARGLPALGTLAVRQLRAVMAAYRDHDAAAAERVRQADAELDAEYTRDRKSTRL